MSLPGAAFARNQDGNIGCGHFPEPRPNRLHDIGMAKDDVVRGKFAERLRQRTYRECRHKVNTPFGGRDHPHALKVHPKSQTGGEIDRGEDFY